MGEQELIQLSIEGNLATISLNRPEKRNAINSKMLEELKKILDDLAMNAEVDAIVLCGNGPCFSSGIDFTELAGLAAVDPKEIGGRVRILAHQIQTVINTMERIEKPVIGKLHGFVGGLGMELVLGCDFRLGTASSTYGVPEIVLGLVPDCGGTTRLTRTLGVSRAKELVMLGEMITAGRAEQFGLINRVFDDDQFEEGVDAFVKKVLNRRPMALGLAKRLIDLGAGMDKMSFMDLEATLQSILISAPDFLEAFQKGMGIMREEMKKPTK